MQSLVLFAKFIRLGTLKNPHKVLVPVQLKPNHIFFVKCCQADLQKYEISFNVIRIHKEKIEPINYIYIFIIIYV